MKKMLTVGFAVMTMLATAGAALGAEITIFSAAASGADVWSWSGARIKQDGDLLAVTEKNPDATYGDVFISEKFPFFAAGQIVFDLAEAAGSCSLQALAFSSEEFLGAVDVLKDTAKIGAQTVSLSSFAFPDGTDRVTFKLWVGGEEGASVKLRDLLYVLPVDDARVLLHKEVDAMTIGETDNVVWTPGERGGEITLSGARDYGSILFPDFIKKSSTGIVMLDAPAVRDGTLTVQLVIFDEDRNYIDSRDVLTSVGAGFSADKLDAIAWPAGTDSYQVKIWLGGKPGCSAQIRRLVVVQ